MEKPKWANNTASKYVVSSTKVLSMITSLCYHRTAWPLGQHMELESLEQVVLSQLIQEENDSQTKNTAERSEVK